MNDHNSEILHSQIFPQKVVSVVRTKELVSVKEAKKGRRSFVSRESKTYDNPAEDVHVDCGNYGKINWIQPDRPRKRIIR